LTNLRGWEGAQSWAATERAWLESLVSADDPKSREELRSWIDGSLVETLREVRKDMNRGLLAGHQTPGVLAQRSEIPFAGAFSSGATAKVKVEEVSKVAPPAMARSDHVEDAQLQEALLLSAGEERKNLRSKDADAASNAANKSNNPMAARSDHFEDKQLQEALSLSAGEERPNLRSKDVHAASNAATICGHACNLAAGHCQPTACCHCTFRAPRQEVLVALESWWRQKSLASDRDLRSDQWRFLCVDCSRGSAVGARAVPLPFGGQLVQDGTVAHSAFVEERVEPKASASVESDMEVMSEVTDWDAWSEANLSAEDGSWVVVEPLAPVFRGTV